jgi:hypothetical protein
MLSDTPIIVKRPIEGTMNWYQIGNCYNLRNNSYNVTIYLGRKGLGNDSLVEAYRFTSNTPDGILALENTNS